MSRPRHIPIGTERLCERCEVPATLHAKRRNRQDYYRQRNIGREYPQPRDRIIGIDGEGQGRFPHLYTYLAAVDESGKLSVAVQNDKGLSTEECFDFLLSMPPKSLCFGYAFVYDLTKICQDLPDSDLYKLFHEEKRARLVEGRVIYKPVHFHGYTVNYMNRRFTLSDGKRRVTIWDIFRFFASKFTSALIDWKVADETKLRRMAEMKDQRADFDKLDKGEIHAYCKEECAYLARLGRKLIAAHDDAGIKLKSFFGAGSTASALLDKLCIRDKRGDIPVSMRLPIASAFFGGRFENSVVGPVEGPVYDYDISSAYPYHASLLPCLCCGSWRHSKTVRNVRTALVHWTSDAGAIWGALPVRDEKGTIRFPLSGKGGWAWGPEFFAAQRFNPSVRAVEAWVYETDCDHKPFADLPFYYRERVKLGKDAQGLVLKLGMNSVYGKLAQSKGLNPKYQSWVWAGLITAGCRGQLLDLVAQDPANVLMLATDGVWTRSKLRPPAPVDTGTGDLPKPLGGWEEKVFERGVFAVRPGIYFPLEPTEDELEKVRARGLGRKLLYQQWAKVVHAFERRKPFVKLSGVSRFVGAKSGFRTKGGQPKRSKDLGEWIEYPIEVTFNPKPKRERVMRDGTLKPWAHLDYESVPYKRATLSPEAALLAIAQAIAEEQPDADFADMEDTQ